MSKQSSSSGNRYGHVSAKDRAMHGRQLERAMDFAEGDNRVALRIMQAVCDLEVADGVIGEFWGVDRVPSSGGRILFPQGDPYSFIVNLHAEDVEPGRVAKHSIPLSKRVGSLVVATRSSNGRLPIPVDTVRIRCDVGRKKWGNLVGARIAGPVCTYVEVNAPDPTAPFVASAPGIGALTGRACFTLAEDGAVKDFGLERTDQPGCVTQNLETAEVWPNLFLLGIRSDLQDQLVAQHAGGIDSEWGRMMRETPHFGSGGVAA